MPEFKAGVFWVGLASLGDPALVAEHIAQTLGAKDGLADHIGEREMLLLLDNLEQVVEAAPELSALVEACPNLTLLVTSRELLRVRERWSTRCLRSPKPRRSRSSASARGLEPNEDDRRALRAPGQPPARRSSSRPHGRSVLSPAQILERLSRRLDLLKGGRDADPRQQTLRATIAWCTSCLDREQRLFTRLSVFAGGCTLEAAEEVAEADLDRLQSLVEKSLLRFTRMSATGCWRRSASTRRERLEDADEAHNLRSVTLRTSRARGGSRAAPRGRARAGGMVGAPRGGARQLRASLRGLEGPISSSDSA